MRAVILGAVFSVLLTSRIHAQPAQAVEVRKGFVEAGLGWGYQMSNAQFIETSRGTKLEPLHESGLLLDVAGGYQLTPGLAVIGDLQHARASSIEGVNQDGDRTDYSTSQTGLAAGVRLAVAAGPGEVYSDFSLGVEFPFETHRDRTNANGSTDHVTVGYNSALGARGEVGYHYGINDRLYIGVGLRLEAFSTDNVGRTRVRVDNNGQTDTTTYTTDPNAQGNNTDPAEALSVQDLRMRISVGFRF